ncbi:MAG: DUF721 domain-containing protein, partial [Pseudomonadota bacterium]
MAFDKRTRLRNPLPAGELVSRWLGRQKLDGELTQYNIQDRWMELVGERIAARTEPGKLRDKTLTVAVASSAWLNELVFLRNELVQKINGKLQG